MQQQPKVEAFIQHGKAGGPYRTESVAHQTREAPRSGQTRTGYGAKLPTDHMVHYNGRWRRVYAVCYSNVASHYILAPDNSKLFVRIDL